jgi:U3 small nucleolar RNA-associated protein 15
VLTTPQNPSGLQEAMTLFTALRHRNALRVALEGRDEDAALPLFRWIARHITDARYVHLLTEIALTLVDIYSENYAFSPKVEPHLLKLHQQTREGVAAANLACNTKGMIDMLVS